jgi:hypothetical protein
MIRLDAYQLLFFPIFINNESHCGIRHPTRVLVLVFYFDIVKMPAIFIDEFVRLLPR